jgi:ABC-2 type transport system permease protein
VIARIGAMVLRYLLLIRRDYSRVVDLVYWPLLDITVWGLFTFFLWRAQMQVPNAMAMLLGGAILWNVFLRAAQDVSVSFLDDVWARSVVTTFASPLTFGEFGASVMVVGLTKVAMSLVVMSVVAWALYAFDLLALGWALVPFAANLVLFGWVLGLVALAIIIRFGGRWQILAWSLPFAAMPVSCVFYPQGVLPPALRALAGTLPSTHVFEGMRAVLLEQRVPWDRLAWATGLNLLYLGLAAGLVAWVLRVALDRGLLPKIR